MERWPRLKLDDCVDLLAGFPFKSQQFTDNPDDVPLVKGENVSQGCILWDKSKHWPASHWDNLEKFHLRPGDVVIAMDRPWIPAGLKWSFIRENDPRSLLVQRCARLRSSKEDLDQGFLRFVIGAPAFEGYVKPIATGVNVPHISGKQILDFEFTLPPLSIQRRIAGILSAYDDLIENSQRRIKILEEMARRLYREWFVDSVESDSWPDTQLGDLIELKRGYDLPAKDRRQGIIPIVSSSGITGFHDAPMATGPGIVTGRYGTLGEVHLVWNEFWPLNTSLYVKDFKETPFLYVLWLLRRILPNQKGSAAAVPGLNRNDLHSLPVKSPPPSVMKNFHDFCLPLASQARCLNHSIENLHRTRDLLLPRLISGKIDVEALPEPVLSES